MTKRLAIGILALLASFSSMSAQSKAWDILREIVLVPGVSGHEGPVSYFIQGRLPATLSGRDAMNASGSPLGQGAPYLFVAHSDGSAGSSIDHARGHVKVKPGGIRPRRSARPVLIPPARRRRRERLATTGYEAPSQRRRRTRRSPQRPTSISASTPKPKPALAG
jgi:hypothetical protein